LAAEGVVSHFDLAVLGADDPLGESFLKALEEADVPVGRLHPLVLGEAEGIVAFRGEEWPCLPVDGFDFSQTQALVVASPHPAASRLAEEIRGRRGVMPVLLLQEVVPAPALAVARVLKVLAAAGKGVEQAEAFVTLPVALAGKAGVDELVHQARGLFSMESPDPEVFPLQIAFNIIPQLDVASQRYSPADLAAATATHTGMPPPGFTVAWAPVFYGGVTALHVRLGQAVSLDELRAVLKQHEGLCLMESDLPAGNPTPATDSLESADIFLGQVRTDGGGVRLWLVYDPLRLEAAQMVSVVENWIEKPTTSMLT